MRAAELPVRPRAHRGRVDRGVELGAEARLARPPHQQQLQQQQQQQQRQQQAEVAAVDGVRGHGQPPVRVAGGGACAGARTRPPPPHHRGGRHRAQGELVVLIHLSALVLCSAPSVPQQVFTIMEKAPTRAFYCFKVPTSAITFKTLLSKTLC